ncbi:Beta-mannosidase B [Plasmodiophora brassicae]
MCGGALLVWALWGAAVAAGVGIVLDGVDWMLTNANGTIAVPGSVPGNVYTDLRRAGVIGDPLWRFNERVLSWIPNEPYWTYSKTFVTAPEGSGAGLLIIEGLDTIADVFMNGDLVGQADNMFRTWTFPVDNLRPSSSNTIGVRIYSPVASARQRAQAYPYPLPSSDVVGHSFPHRNMIRKAQFDFGWDWGPAFASSGIAGPIRIVTGYTPVLQRCEFVQHHFHNGSVRVDVVFRTHPSGPVADVIASASFGDQTKSVSSIISEGHTAVSISFDVTDPRLWWPNGFGESPYLYEASCSIGYEQTITRKVGLRRIEVVGDEIDGEEGNTFSFRINGVDTFIKGANVIPLSPFASSVTDEDIRILLENAAAANMNMVRVWGGGIYQPDIFYETADRLGLMIWQEIMFACATYPRDDAFLENVRLEVMEQVGRLRSYASVVVIGGNNENEIALSWFNETRENPRLYVADYAKLYVDVIRDAVRRSAPELAFIVSSPSNGLMSESPYVLRWGNPSDGRWGDVHFYDYASDVADPATYPDARFISEFGYQSLPSIVTWRTVAEEADLSWGSPLLEYRQRHPDGYLQLWQQIELQFGLPRPASFPTMVFLTQAVQSVCYRTAIEKWRRARASAARTMGILYWQLNSIWPAPTWSSLEAGGQHRWKMLHYSIRDAFAPLMISLVDTGAAGVEAHLVSDLPRDVNVVVCIQLWSWSGVKLEERCFNALVRASTSRIVFADDVSAWTNAPASRADYFVRATFVSSLPVPPLSGSSELALVKYKRIRLRDPGARVDSIVQSAPNSLTLRVAVQNVAVMLFFETDLQGTFSSNALFALPGTLLLSFTARDAVSVADLRRSLRITSLYDVMAATRLVDTM